MFLISMAGLLIRRFSMSLGMFFVFFCVFTHLVPLTSTQEINQTEVDCPKSFDCGSHGQLSFPFSDKLHPQCGLCTVDCDEKPPKVTLEREGYSYDAISMQPGRIIQLEDRRLEDRLSKKSCETFSTSLPNSPSISFEILHNLTLFKCNNDPKFNQSVADHFRTYLTYDSCNDFNIYFSNPKYPLPSFLSLPTGCELIQLPMQTIPSLPDRPSLFQLLSPNFTLEWHLSGDCLKCHSRRGLCETDDGGLFRCSIEGGDNKSKIILATVLPVGALILIGSVVFIVWRRKKGNYGFLYFLSRNTSSDPSSNQDPEGGSLYFGVPIFSYSELVEATGNFNSSKELGDGGFGTVYHGKLRDGREVAVKRLYEHNYKRVEQFMNEIEILTRLRHCNLVSLYGCTSRHSRELLLVYEYIPNGTVADHLQGERAQDEPLNWHVRMNIAIETANALAYLHASDIIHRDVKTSNILLDNNFCVKVADFGLSRLFPTDVTHVSTAPQGTPGYVDPEYRQCYQLTDKSDVYSFGVVLIELISSMPAVDICRHRHEINLANLAINRIQRCAFDELIDPSLGHKSDTEVKRMTTSVAELAFQCLQLEKEMRPTMEEVLENLHEIQNCKDNLIDKTDETTINKAIESKRRIVPPSPESEDIVLLKNVKFPSSPNSVVDACVRSSSTTSTSR